MENFDQTTSTALQHWDDHEDLSTYKFGADSMQAPNNDDDKRKLAYRYRLAVAISERTVCWWRQAVAFECKCKWHCPVAQSGLLEYGSQSSGWWITQSVIVVMYPERSLGHWSNQSTTCVLIETPWRCERCLEYILRLEPDPIVCTLQVNATEDLCTL